jgi:hypothetical protein
MNFWDGILSGFFAPPPPPFSLDGLFTANNAIKHALWKVFREDTTVEDVQKLAKSGLYAADLTTT